MENTTLNQIAYSIFETVRGQINDDDNISIEHIKDLVHDVRAVLLKQKFDKNARVIEDVFTQSLGLVEIERVDSSGSDLIKSGRYMYRTKQEIPPTISRNNYEGTFTRIGPGDRLSDKYNLVSYDRALYSGNGRFNKDTIFCFLRDNRIYLISSSGMYHRTTQFIDVVGVFDNPKQVEAFKDADGNTMYSDDGRYPVSRTLRDQIESFIVKEKFGIKNSAPSDKTNDGTS